MAVRKTVPPEHRIQQLVAAVQLCRGTAPRRAMRLANEALALAVSTADAATVADLHERLHRMGFALRGGEVVVERPAS